jgi:adenylate cyclase class 2
LTQFRQHLIDAGAELISPKIYEKNLRYDTPWQSLQLQGKLLRLRQDRAVRLTFKGPAQEAANSEARVREELEVNASDFDTLAGILERIGLEPVQVYEKYRETYEMDNVEIVIDQMPFGDFVELEGEERDIRETAGKLGLDWRERILANYLSLMAKAKDFYQLTFNDLTFDNFTDLNVSMAEVIKADKSAHHVERHQ